MNKRSIKKVPSFTFPLLFSLYMVMIHCRSTAVVKSERPFIYQHKVVRSFCLLHRTAPREKSANHSLAKIGINLQQQQKSTSLYRSGWEECGMLVFSFFVTPKKKTPCKSSLTHSFIIIIRASTANGSNQGMYIFVFYRR